LKVLERRASWLLRSSDAWCRSTQEAVATRFLVRFASPCVALHRVCWPQARRTASVTNFDDPQITESTPFPVPFGQRPATRLLGPWYRALLQPQSDPTSLGQSALGEKAEIPRFANVLSLGQPQFRGNGENWDGHLSGVNMAIAEQTKKRILVVEDEGLIAADVQSRLERLGYSVPAIAQSGEEALQCARSTPLDLVLMDIRIKGEMDGIATAAALKAECQMPVVYMTAYSDQVTVNRAKLTEPFGYVMKPVDDGNLRSTVQIALYKSEMERSLRTSQTWLSATLRSVGDGIIATDTYGEIVFMNPAAEQLTSWSSADARGRQLMEVLGLFEELTNRPAENPVTRLLRGENRIYTLRSKTATRLPVEIQCFENRTVNQVLGAIVVVRDIRARKEVEDRLVRSQRMEAVANVSVGMANEFKEQLAVVLGYAQELATCLSGEEQQDALAIERAASRATFISSQLLMLSRRDAAQMEVFNIHGLIREVQPCLSETLGKTRCLTTDLGSPAGLVRADRNQIKQALLNLTLNARDAMESGGELRIESRTVEIGDDTPEGRLHRPGLYVHLRFTNSGEGLDKAILARIFEPIFTAKEPGCGSGLGLALVHNIIVNGGGYITAASVLGKGTTFEILMPCIGTFHGIADVPVDGAGGDEVPTILLVEDEDSICRPMHRYLEREGMQLLEARNSEEAELIAEVYQDPIHVLVTDVVMPDMTGPQLAQRLARLRPEMKVLFFSRYRHHTQGQQGLDQSANILSKPFPAKELIRRVRLLLDKPTPQAR
jgi:two-component system cell cycle sensor histidine kinase/response regulator CckA